MSGPISLWIHNNLISNDKKKSGRRRWLIPDHIERAIPIRLPTVVTFDPARRGRDPQNDKRVSKQRQLVSFWERATGLEPATSSLGSWHSTTELRPRHNVDNARLRHKISGFPPTTIFLIGGHLKLLPDIISVCIRINYPIPSIPVHQICTTIQRSVSM
jgi:hypothetical protein